VRIDCLNNSFVANSHGDSLRCYVHGAEPSSADPAVTVSPSEKDHTNKSGKPINGQGIAGVADHAKEIGGINPKWDLPNVLLKPGIG
jgi:hypothetical protein